MRPLTMTGGGVSGRVLMSECKLSWPEMIARETIRPRLIKSRYRHE